MSSLFIDAFAVGDGGPSSTSVDPKGDTFTSPVSSNLGACKSERRKRAALKSASVTYMLGNMSQ